MSRPTIFLDRDGTINVEKGYLYRCEDWEWIPGAIEAIKALNDAGFLVVVVSNQSGVARGLYTQHDIDLLHCNVDDMLAAQGAHIDRYYHCTHHPKFGENRQCTCRKPLPGLLLKAQKDLSIDMNNSWMIGDKLSDIAAGQAAGVRTLMVATGYGLNESLHLPSNARFCENIHKACAYILSIS